MALNWQLAPIPPGGTFNDALYNFLLPIEAPTENQRLYPSSVNG